MAFHQTQKTSRAILNSRNPRNEFSLIVEALCTFYQKIYLVNVLLFKIAKLSFNHSCPENDKDNRSPTEHLHSISLRGPALALHILTLQALLRYTPLATTQQPSIPRLPWNLTQVSVQTWPGSVPSPRAGLLWAEPIVVKLSPLRAQTQGPAPTNEMLLGVG